MLQTCLPHGIGMIQALFKTLKPFCIFRVTKLTVYVFLLTALFHYGVTMGFKAPFTSATQV